MVYDGWMSEQINRQIDKDWPLNKAVSTMVLKNLKIDQIFTSQ